MNSFLDLRNIHAHTPTYTHTHSHKLFSSRVKNSGRSKTVPTSAHVLYFLFCRRVYPLLFGRHVMCPHLLYFFQYMPPSVELLLPFFSCCQKMFFFQPTFLHPFFSPAQFFCILCISIRRQPSLLSSLFIHLSWVGCENLCICVCARVYGSLYIWRVYSSMYFRKYHENYYKFIKWKMIICKQRNNKLSWPSVKIKRERSSVSYVVLSGCDRNSAMDEGSEWNPLILTKIISTVVCRSPSPKA